MTMLDPAARIVFQFFLYGMAGWGVEVAYAAVKEGRLVNRGFLCGPICPIYGFGMIALTQAVALLPAAGGDGPSWLECFAAGAVITTTIELIGGVTLYKLYHTRWWDYSHLPGNLGGYICPQFTVLWGLGSMLMVKVVHPALLRAQSPMPLTLLLWIDGVLLVFFAADVAVSTAAAVGLDRRLRQIDEMRRAMRTTSDKLTSLIGTGAMTADTLFDQQKLQLTLAAMDTRDNAADLKAELTRRAAALSAAMEELGRDRFGARRLLRAFPTMKSLRYADAMKDARSYVTRLSAAARHTARAAAEKLGLNEKDEK